jgi:hypothetical protein
MPPWTGFFFGWSVIVGLARHRDFATGWDWSERLLPQAPESRSAAGFWRVRARLAARLGRWSEAADAERRARMLAAGAQLIEITARQQSAAAPA